MPTRLGKEVVVIVESLSLSRQYVECLGGQALVNECMELRHDTRSCQSPRVRKARHSVRRAMRCDSPTKMRRALIELQAAACDAEPCYELATP